METLASPMQQLITELQQQAIIWLYLLSWLSLMIYTHTPPRRIRSYTPKQKRRNLMIAALVWVGLLSALSLIPSQ